MPQKVLIPYPVSQYEKVLKKIIDFSQENSSAFNNKEIDIISFCLCEQDNEYENYSLKQDGKGNFNLYLDVERASIKSLAKRIHNFDNRNNNLPPEKIIKDYLERAKPLLTQYEIKKEGIKEKVKTKMQKLENLFN